MTPDLVQTSGRETMSVSSRIGLLETELMFPPFNGIGDATRSVTQAIHDLKLTVGWMRSSIVTYKEAVARGQTDQTLAKGADTMLSWLECLILALKRGGHEEWVRVRKEQHARRQRGEMR